ncbi:MAG TPA: thioredoxin family protein [Aquabacterium sp.]|nr:thioredoxin family protein [Aquabacterium sp.]
MAVMTPFADIGWPAPSFRLKGVDGRYHSLKQLAGPKGTVVVFISNNCPYVQAVMPRLIRDAQELDSLGVHTIAINANDVRAYPEDGYANMKLKASEWGLPFHYLHDDTQEVAHAFGAVCTPDFFGFDGNLRLQYRGRLDALRTGSLGEYAWPRELYDAMRLIAHYGYGPGEQEPSVGCAIRWRQPPEDSDLSWRQPIG